jgi:hypothetical protein
MSNSIHDFARAGETEDLSAMLNADPSKLEEVEAETNCTLLATAVSHGQLSTVIMLLDR